MGGKENRGKGEIKKPKGEENVAEKKTEEKKEKEKKKVLCWLSVWCGARA